MEKLADALPVERAASRWIVCYDPADAAQRIGRYVGLDFNHVVFHARGPDQAQFLSQFGEQIAPRLRAAYGSHAATAAASRSRQVKLADDRSNGGEETCASAASPPKPGADHK